MAYMLKTPKVLLYHKPALALLSGLARAELHRRAISRPVPRDGLGICRGNHLRASTCELMESLNASQGWAIQE